MSKPTAEETRHYYKSFMEWLMHISPMDYMALRHRQPSKAKIISMIRDWAETITKIETK